MEVDGASTLVYTLAVSMTVERIIKLYSNMYYVYLVKVSLLFITSCKDSVAKSFYFKCEELFGSEVCIYIRTWFHSEPLYN